MFFQIFFNLFVSWVSWCLVGLVVAILHSEFLKEALGATGVGPF